MMFSRQSLVRPRWLLAVLIALLVFYLALATPASAQTPLCAGLPATIVGTLTGPINGTSGSDVIVGTAGDDLIAGLGGNDTICAGSGNDTLIWNPGDGSDTIEGQADTDRLLFSGANVNEQIDLSANGARLHLSRDVASVTLDLDDVELVQPALLGGADTITMNDLTGTDVTQVNLNLEGSLNSATGDTQADSVIVNATGGDDTITITNDSNQVIVHGLQAPISIRAIDTALDSLQVNGLAGADTISANAPPAQQNKLFLSLVVAPEQSSGVVTAMSSIDPQVLPAGPASGAAIKLTLNGGPGSDTLTGSSGSDQIVGGPANDTALLGAGDDTFIWNPGDGSDVVEGQDGIDRLLFNGANVSEQIDLSANGTRLRFFRDVANIIMDVDGTEQVTFNALGGVDTITINDLSSSAVAQVGLNLSGTLNGTIGDAQGDSVRVQGTAASDGITISGTTGSVAVAGLASSITITALDGLQDGLIVNGLAGDDTISAATLPAGLASLTIDGGSENDQLQGSAGADILLGNDGNDQLDGNQGNDTAFLGADDDIFTWNPGDGSDTIEGQAGTDQLLFSGANVSELIDLSANGGRVRFIRNVGSITMDVNDVEQVTFNALGGADTITVNDLTGTDVTEVNLNLAGVLNGSSGDAQADSITVHGTNGADVAIITGSSGSVTLTGTGLSPTIAITSAEPALDSLRLNLLAGDDVADVSGLAASSVTLTLDGGDNDDVLIGSAGADTIFGGAGDDILIGGPGIDILDGGSGNNVIIPD